MFITESLPYEDQEYRRLEGQVMPPDLEEVNVGPSKPGNWVSDVIKAPFKGVANAAISTGELVWDTADFITGDSLPNWDPERYQSDTIAGGIIQGAANFLTGFIPVFGWLGKAKSVASLGNVARGAIAGGITDFTVFDAQEGNLSSLIQSYPKLQNPVTEFLSTSDEDSEASGRLKNVLEGLGLGVMTEGVMKGLRGLRKARRIKAESGSPREVYEGMVDEFESPEELSSHLPQPKGEQLNQDLTPERADELVKGSKANLDAILSEEDASDVYTALSEKMALEGDVVTVKEQVRASTEEFIKEVYGQDFEGIVAYFQKATGDAISALRRIAVLPSVIGEQQDVLRAAIQKGIHGSEKDMAEAFLESSKLEMLSNLHVAVGKPQARAFNLRREINKKLLESNEVVRELLSNIGSEKYLRSTLERWALAEGHQLTKAVRNQVSITERVFRAHNEYFINSILSGPQTAMVNGLSNSFTSFFLPAERALGALDNPSVLRASLRQYVFAYHSAKESLRMAFKALKSDEPILRGPYGGGLSRSDVIDKNKITSEYLGLDPKSNKGRLTDFLGKLVRMPTRLLLSTDEFFQQINYRSAAQMRFYEDALSKGATHKEAAEMAATKLQQTITQSGEVLSEAAIYRNAHQQATERGLRGLEKAKFVDKYVADNWDPNNSMLAELANVAEYAKDQAAEATFTRKLEPGTIGYDIQKFIQRHPMAQLAVPFVRTPINLLKFVGQRTFPLAQIKGIDTPVLSKIHKRALQDLTSGDPFRVAEAKGRLMTGAAIFSTASALVYNNKITGGGPPSEAERKIAMETGWRPYSFVIDDQYISYLRFDPFSTLFGVIADYAYFANRQDDVTQSQAQMISSAIIVSLTQNITNKSYLAGIAKVVEALNQPERFGASTARQQAASYIPNLLAQATVALGDDTAMREVRTLSDAILGRIPGATYALEPRRNILGKVVERSLHTTDFLGNPVDWVNPSVLSHDRKDKVFQELADLQHGFTQPTPTLMGRINMLDYKNKQGQSSYDRWLEIMGTMTIGGQDLHSALSNLVTSKSYRRLASKQDLVDADIAGIQTDRIGRINKVLTRYRKIALRKTYEEFPELKEEAFNTTKLRRAKLSRESAQQLQALVNQ